MPIAPGRSFAHVARPSLPGITPSTTRKAQARDMSAIQVIDLILSCLNRFRGLRLIVREEIALVVIGCVQHRLLCSPPQAVSSRASAWRHNALVARLYA